MLGMARTGREPTLIVLNDLLWRKLGDGIPTKETTAYTSPTGQTGRTWISPATQRQMRMFCGVHVVLTDEPDFVRVIFDTEPMPEIPDLEA